MINFRDELIYARSYLEKKKSSNPHIKDWERLEIQKIYFSLSTVRR